MKQLVWKWNRLRAMNVAEVGHRLQDALHTRLQAWGWGLARLRPPDTRQFGQPWADPLPRTVDVMRHRTSAERILSGYFDIFALENTQLGFPPNFNRDPKNGVQAPLEFGKQLNYRDEKLVGDIKYLWEPNRHLAVTTLAQAYHLTGELRYATGVQRMLSSWFDQCPYPLGANWVSSLELAIRLVNWSFAWHLLGGKDSRLFQDAEGQQFMQRWLDNIYQHCHFIAGYWSRHSSANNHLFGELLGLYVAAVTWPCWRESAHWQHHAAYELEQQALIQNAADGVNLEQAIYYQHEVCDMMLVCILVGRANGCPFSATFSRRLEKMLEFIAAMIDKNGNVPAIGDSDDALLVNWSQFPDWNLYRSLLATGAVMFKRADFKARAGNYDDKSCWLLGDLSRDAFAALSETDAASAADGNAPVLPQAFPEGGYYVLGDGFNTAQEVHLVADCGPLGFLSIAAHGHADALAMTLSAAGHPILIDPGTYAYHTQKKWRDYFRGTSAHNTVRVDELDQSEAAGNFLWLRKARAHCEYWRSTAELDTWIASHDGYMHLPDPVLHRRKIEYNKQKREILIEDILQCQAAHLLEWHWHFAPQCTLEQVSRQKFLIRCGPVRIEMTLPAFDSEVQLVRAQETPPLGWDAPCFDMKIPATTMV
ncbi:MAG: hypothetical protein RL748_1625 [Pseudomonadota bacterium]